MRYCLMLLLLVILPAQAQWHKDEQAIMGTVIRVELWQEDAKRGRQAITAVMTEMRRIDTLMSPYIMESELSRINREAAHGPLGIGKELFDLIDKSLEFSRLTGGAFDITFASVGRLYDYRKRLHPDEQAIRENLPKINYRHIVLDREKQTIRFAVDGVYIDLGGIAKGHAVDNGIRILQSHGIRHAMITAGGDSRILGDKRGRPWMIGIRSPRKSGSVSGVLPLVDAALSTSGDYERYFVQDGEHYHHILNPRTGHSARDLQSVSVIGPDATTTDALSTSIFVMGPERGMRLVESLAGIEAVLIDAQGVLHYSSGLTGAGPARAPVN